MPNIGEINVPPPPPTPPETRDALRALLNQARQHAYEEGVKAERARVLRARNEVFTGVVVDDAVLALNQKLDALLLRKEDPHA